MYINSIHMYIHKYNFQNSILNSYLFYEKDRRKI